MNISFETEKKFEWCKYLFKEKYRQGSYDYYFKLNNKEYIIEMDGGWHTQDNSMSKQTAEESRYIDDEKDKLAREHDVEVIRIDCDYINYNYHTHIKQNILINDKLNELFDLSFINWDEILKFSLTSRVKEACEIKRNNPNMTTVEIGKIMRLWYTTIQKYLKKGNILSWCEYDIEKEKYKGRRKAGKSSGKNVVIFKDGNSLGVFPSNNELERKSEELFGVRLASRTISAVCTGKRKQYKGYTFKYTSDLTLEQIKQIQENATLTQAI